jgi:hypothetical protein
LKTSKRCIRWLALPLEDRRRNNIDELVTQLQDPSLDICSGAVEQHMREGGSATQLPLNL